MNDRTPETINWITPNNDHYAHDAFLDLYTKHEKLKAEKAELVEALLWALENIEYAKEPKLIHTPEDTVRKIKAALEKAGVK